MTYADVRILVPTRNKTLRQFYETLLNKESIERKYRTVRPDPVMR